MKKDIRIRANSLKRGDCFRLTVNGSIYMADTEGDAQVIVGRNLGRLWGYDSSRLVYQTKVNIVEEK